MSTGSLARQGRKDVRAYLTTVTHDPCSYCGATATGLDHIDSARTGGADDWANLTAACQRCNSRKRTTSLLGYLLWERYEPDFLIAREAAKRASAAGRLLRGIGT